MRRPFARTMGTFALVFVAALAGLTALWPHVAPAYTSGVATVARPVFRIVESPNATVLDVQGDELGVYRIVGEGQITPIVVFDRYLCFAVVPLIALFLATPALGVRRRALRLAVALAGLFFVHVVYLVASIELIYAVGAGASVAGWQIAVRVFWEAAPILLWAAFTTSAWKRVLQDIRTQGTDESESLAAEPVGAEG